VFDVTWDAAYTDDVHLRVLCDLPMIAQEDAGFIDLGGFAICLVMPVDRTDR
jgi:hypothetical protein